jgi:hypothetical protein
MIDGDTFDKLAHIACSVKNAHPFGGIQVGLLSSMRCILHTTAL